MVSIPDVIYRTFTFSRSVNIVILFHRNFMVISQCIILPEIFRTFSVILSICDIGHHLCQRDLKSNLMMPSVMSVRGSVKCDDAENIDGFLAVLCYMSIILKLLTDEDQSLLLLHAN